MPSWTCKICDQAVELGGDDRPRWPVMAYENCKLQHHYVNNTCIAYARLEVAKELMMMAAKPLQSRWESSCQ